MLLSDLTKGYAVSILGGETDVLGLEYDSRRVKSGDLFFCIVGLNFDGHLFAAEAVQNGAVAIVTQRELDLDVCQVVAADSRVAMAELSARFFGYPAKELAMVGVTGTNGKTTTTHMLKAVCEQMGYKTGLIGTIMNMISDERVPTDRTTPESLDLHRLLARMRDEGVKIVVMEVSSHSLVQQRVRGIQFAVGVFTNLTQDHLDYHKTFENYVEAKRILFKQCDFSVLNADDAYADAIREGFTGKTLTFGVREKADVTAADIDITARGVQFDMLTPKGKLRLHLAIPGLFSVFNAMAAATSALALGLDLPEIKAGLETTSVSGRLEPLTANGNYSIFLDYAHTPDALENVLKTVRGFAPGRIITLFGCGGDRDMAKRPIMGEVAGRYSDYLIVTSDNPRGEEPMDIIQSILVGVVKSGCDYTVIENRREAITFALANAKDNDVIILAGKGHETYQEIKGVKHPFDEKIVVRELLEEL